MRRQRESHRQKLKKRKTIKMELDKLFVASRNLESYIVLGPIDTNYLSITE